MPVPSSSAQAAPNAYAITPSDTAPLPKLIRELRCKPNSGVAGTVHVITLDGDDFTTEIEVGGRLDLIITKVFATGTTATGLEGYL